MKVDRELLREVRAFTRNDGTRETLRPIRMKLRECREALSTPEIMNTFDDVLCKHGRPAVAIILAYTLVDRAWRLDNHIAWWAWEVIKAAQLPKNDPSGWAIIDDLHPTRIFEYAGEFFKMTMEEE